MKTIIKSIIILVIAIFCNGCNDFLSEIPQSSYSVVGSYKTQKDFIQAIAGVYAAQQDLYQGDKTYFRALMSRSDETKTGASYVDGLDDFTVTGASPSLAGFWQSHWLIISRSNLILDKIDEGTFSDANLKNYIKGEALVLRAYAYHNLGVHFGGMPSINKAMSVEELRGVARSTQQETFDFAAKDYEDAFNLLPEEWIGANLGRANKYSAAAMLGRLYMFQGKYTKAKEWLEKVIKSGKYEMETNYIDCFTDQKDNGKERVWEVQFTGGQLGEGQALSTSMIPDGYEGPIQPFRGTSASMTVSLDFLENYEQGDIRKSVSVITGLKAAGVVDLITYRIYKYSHWVAYQPKTLDDWAINLPIIRYTDVMMMYAEALNEIGYSANGEAFDILNKVRKRAGLAAKTSTELSSQTLFRNAIMKERRYEFAFEGLRWDDLVRWGIAKPTMNTFFQRSDEGNGKYKMEDYGKIFPIPYDEMIRYNNDKIMWQNDGY